MSWIERAIAWRRYFGSGDGVRFVHRWIHLTCGATSEWAARTYCELDAAMEQGGHDGASGWGMFRNDVTMWLATIRVEREHLVGVAACIERYLGALGSGHATTTAPIAGRWRAALASGESLDAVVEEARASREMHTAGAGGVLPLIEASAGLLVAISPRPAARSGIALRLPIVVRVLQPASEETHAFAAAPIEIGRAADAHLRIASPLVARTHARIVEDGGLVYEDRRSENGTWLFETQIERVALEHGDVLVLGDILVVVENGL